MCSCVCVCVCVFICLPSLRLVPGPSVLTVVNENWKLVCHIFRVRVLIRLFYRIWHMQKARGTTRPEKKSFFQRLAWVLLCNKDMTKYLDKYDIRVPLMWYPWAMKCTCTFTMFTWAEVPGSGNIKRINQRGVSHLLTLPPPRASPFCTADRVIQV